MSDTSIDNKESNVSFYNEAFPNQTLLSQNLQTWFTDYSPDIAAWQMELYKSQLKSLAAQRMFATLIKPLKSVFDFAQPLLDQQIQKEWGLSIDCRHLYLKEVTALKPRIQAEEQPVLIAALHNFKADKTFLAGSGLYYRAQPYPPTADGIISGDLKEVCGSRIDCSTGRINIEPDAFVKLCRSLDLGGKYEALLNSVFSHEDTVHHVKDAFVLKESSRLEVLTHIARMRNHISQAAYEVMLEVTKANGKPVWGGGAVRYSELDLLASPHHLLHGMLIFESYPGETEEQLANDQGPIVVYMPGEPRHPVKEYPTINAFIGYLRESLNNASYRRYFEQFIAVDEQADFFAQLDNALTPHGRFDPRANLSPLRSTLDDGPFEMLYGQAYKQVFTDASVLAVPVRTLTDRARPGPVGALRALAHFAFDLADVFLPASEVRDLVKDIFISLEDWSDGDRAKALAHLYDLAKEAVLAAAPKLVKEIEKLEKVYSDGEEALEVILEVLKPLTDSSNPDGVTSSANDDEIAELEEDDSPSTANAVSPSAFIEGLVQVKPDNGQPRLWKPDLSPFERESVLPAGTFLDGQSLFRAAGKTWLSMDGNYYQVGFDPALKKWRALNPAVRPKFAPVLETNGAGAWRFEGEDPMGWDVYKAFRRLHGDCASLDDATIDRILRINEVDEALLRQIHVDKLLPPALLVDCTARFLIARDLNDFIGLMNRISDVASIRDTTSATPDAFVAPSIEPYLDFIVTMPGWPEGRLLRLVDAQGNVLSSHGASRNAVRNVDVIYTPGNIMALLDTLMLGLTAAEAESLLVNYQAPRTAGQYLAYRLGAEASGRRQVLFNLVYGTKYHSTNPLIRLVQRDFPSLPYLVAGEIVATADEVERDRMSTAGRIPLRLAEQAREYLQQLRVNRALECFYLHMESPDSDIVSLALINTMPGWPKDLVIEVRKGSFNGETIFRSGGENTKPEDVTLVMVQKGTDYESYNRQGQRSHFSTLSFSKTLTHQGRVARDVHNLEVVLGDLATSQRGRVKRALGLQAIKPGIKWPARLPDGRLGYQLSGRLRGLFDKFRNNTQDFSPELAVRRLYPQFTSAQVRTFLEGLAATFVGTASQKRSLVRGRLNELRQEYSTLEAILDRWVAEARYAPSEPLAQITAQAREVARMRILSCWRRESALLVDSGSQDAAYRLDLRNLAIGSLPVITANFAHVYVLALENLGLTAEAAGAFVRCFPELRSLSLKSNVMDAVPPELEKLSSLKALILSRNLIQLDVQGLQRLQRLRGLEVLELEGHELNLNGTFDVSRWPRLQDLRLRLCGLTAVPSGLGVHADLRHVDLRHNRITTVGEQTLLAIASCPDLHVRLHFNSIDARTIAVARNIFSEVALVRMGISEMPGQQPGDQNIAQWLTDTGSAEQLQRWADLQRGAEGEAFVQLVKDLFSTADYRDNRQLLAKRLWRMVDAMSESEALREELFELAAHPQTCGDGTMVIFNMLDVRVLVSRLEASPDGKNPIAMYKLIRGLERLDELDRIALRDFAARVVSHPNLDQVEVRLIYPTLLREKLELPGQAQAMLFENLSGVDQGMIDSAKAQVLQRERQPGFFRSMIARDDWMTFLKEHYRQPFAKVCLPFHDLQDKLDDQRGSLTDEAYLNRLDTVVTAQKQAVEALSLQLTRDIAQLATTPE